MKDKVSLESFQSRQSLPFHFKKRFRRGKEFRSSLSFFNSRSDSPRKKLEREIYKMKRGFSKSKWRKRCCRQQKPVLRLFFFVGGKSLKGFTFQQSLSSNRSICFPTGNYKRSRASGTRRCMPVSWNMGKTNPILFKKYFSFTKEQENDKISFFKRLAWTFSFSWGTSSIPELGPLLRRRLYFCWLRAAQKEKCLDGSDRRKNV